MSKPKGAVPTDGLKAAAASEPSRLTGKTSNPGAVRWTTTRKRPSRVNCTCAAFAPLRLSERVHCGTGVSTPPRPMRKPATELLPLLSAYTTRLVAATLTGRVPPDEMVVTNVSPSFPTAKLEISLLPAFVAKRTRLFGVSSTAPCEPSPDAGADPSPPVEYVPRYMSEPSARRTYATTALPAASLVCVNTPPGAR